MSGEPTISELEKRIVVVRQNIAGLVEQAAAFSGAGDEARTADRIAEQEQELASPCLTFGKGGCALSD
jgi:hypothetical protein